MIHYLSINNIHDPNIVVKFIIDTNLYFFGGVQIEILILIMLIIKTRKLLFNAITNLSKINLESDKSSFEISHQMDKAVLEVLRTLTSKLDAAEKKIADLE